MPELDTDVDDQDQSEVFDEENTNDADRGPGEDAEQFEDLVDLLDVTRAVGDEDDDEAGIGEEMDDEEIVALARDHDDDDDDLMDDDLAPAHADAFAEEDQLTAETDRDDPDDVDRIARRSADEVELEYRGDLNDLEGAASAAQTLESARLSDSDLRELDYKDEFTRDGDDEEAG